MFCAVGERSANTEIPVKDRPCSRDIEFILLYCSLVDEILAMNCQAEERIPTPFKNHFLQ